MVTGFSHLQLVVTDVDASAAWFGEVLGVVEFVRGTTDDGSGRYIGLRHPTARFVVGLQTPPPGAPPPVSSGVDHLSFAVADLASLLAARARLTAAGLAPGEIVEETVSHNVQLVSPDGLRVELTAPKARSGASASPRS